MHSQMFELFTLLNMPFAIIRAVSATTLSSLSKTFTAIFTNSFSVYDLNCMTLNLVINGWK